MLQWHINPDKAEIFLYGDQSFFEFEIIINVFMNSFHFIWVPILWFYGSMAIIFDKYIYRRPPRWKGQYIIYYLRCYRHQK